MYQQPNRKTERTAADVIDGILATRAVMAFCRAGVHFEMGDDSDGVYDGDLFVINELMERVEIDLLTELFEMSKRHYGHQIGLGSTESALARVRAVADPVVMERVETVLPKIGELSRKMRKALS